MPGTTYMESVLSVTQTAPPGSPATGDQYIVPSGATGAWAGHDKTIAAWNGSAWVFSYVAPGLRGRTCRAQDTGLVWIFDSSNDPALFESAAIEIVFDGLGSAITTSITPVIVTLPYACRIAEALVVADQSGSIVVDVQKASFATTPSFSSICASAKPTLSSAQTVRDTTLTGWTRTLAANDLLKFVVNSASTVELATVILRVQEIVPNFND